MHVFLGRIHYKLIDLFSIIKTISENLSENPQPHTKPTGFKKPEYHEPLNMVEGDTGGVSNW